MSSKYALLIANTDYNDPALAKLSAPGNDAEEFARVLRSQDICGFDDVKVLLNQLSSSIIESIDEFFDQRKLDDLLVLYFSGHGVRDEFGSLYLACKNTSRPRLRSTAIKSDYIREAMDESRSKRQLLILDCCNSGAFPQGTKAEVGGPMGMTTAFQGSGRYVLTASDATQFAWEGDKVIGTTESSLFTHFLVKGLEGEADEDGDGKITVDKLYDYAFEQIAKVTPKQTPTKSATKQEGEIILRQITRLEDIKAMPLPAALLDSIENPFAEVRVGAVQELARLLSGRNLGMARSAREALSKIAAEDDSYRVRQAAAQILESNRQVEQSAQGERRTKDQAADFAAQKAEEEPLALEMAQAEQKREAEQAVKEDPGPATSAETEEKRRATEDAMAKLRDREVTQQISALDAERVRKNKQGMPNGLSKLPWRAIAIAGAVIVAVIALVYAAIKYIPRGGEPTMQASAVDTPTGGNAGSTNEAPITTGVGAPFMLQTEAAVYSLAYSPDGRMLASAGSDNNITLWDTATNQKLGEPLTGHADSVSSVAFSPDGKTLASGSDDKSIRLWDVATHQLIGQPLTATKFVESVAFSPDGKTLASGSVNDSIRLWDVATHQLIGQPLTGHTDAVSSVAFSPDGKTLASGSVDKSIRLWDVATHQLIGQPLTGHTDAVSSVAFSPDGKTLASGSFDKSIRLWDVAGVNK